MKKLGIIGGIGPESTIEYYRLIIRNYQRKLNTKEYPEMLIHSINMTGMLRHVFAEELDQLVALLVEKVNVLEKAGADFAVLASNTPHLVFEQLNKIVNLPMISIVDATCQVIAQKGQTKLALLGTKSTMSEGFYQKTGEKHGIEMFIPSEPQQDYVHEKYMGELVFNRILPQTKQELMKIIRELQDRHGVQGVILGGTELPLILQQSDFEDLVVYDTTQIHVGRIVDVMVE